MSKEKNVINYYVLCNKLKNVIRTGWLDWNVTRDRVESIAEHIFGVQMLAIAMKSEYKYDIDLTKVIFMLAIHELGEIIIGDLTQFQITKEEKEELEHKAVHDILDSLIDGKYIEELFLEFDEKKTPEAKFAYQCDKLECDLQCKLYDQENCVDFNKQENNKSFYHPDVQKYYKEELTKQLAYQESLNNKKANINSKEYIEEVAREKLDMYLPNEKVYIDKTN